MCPRCCAPPDIRAYCLCEATFLFSFCQVVHASTACCVCRRTPPSSLSLQQRPSLRWNLCGRPASLQPKKQRLMTAHRRVKPPSCTRCVRSAPVALSTSRCAARLYHCAVPGVRSVMLQHRCSPDCLDRVDALLLAAVPLTSVVATCRLARLSATARASLTRCSSGRGGASRSRSTARPTSRRCQTPARRGRRVRRGCGTRSCAAGASTCCPCPWATARHSIIGPQVFRQSSRRCSAAAACRWQLPRQSLEAQVPKEGSVEQQVAIFRVCLWFP